MATSLEVFVPDRLWLAQYFVRLAGARINARMTVIRLRSSELVVHSPCAFDAALWEFERVLLSHGDLITGDAKQVVTHAWRKILG